MEEQAKEETKATQVVFGGVQLEILDQKSSFVPTFTSPIKLNTEFEQLLAVAIQNDTPGLIIGETGTGKTSIVREIAYLRKQGYTRINMNGYTTPDDLIGSKSVKNGATYYEDGILTKAMKEGHMCVLDEINATPPDATFIIHGLLDDDRRVVLPNGDIIRPHKDFRVFATMNPDYEGTKSLNRAFLDRFGVIMHFDIPDADIEIGILQSKGKVQDIDLATKMVTLAHRCREVYRAQKTLTFVSTRSLLQWASLLATSKLDTRAAYVAAIANKARPEERAAFEDYFNSVFKQTPAEEPDAYVLTRRKVVDGYEKQIKDALDKVRQKDARIRVLETDNTSTWKAKAEGAEKELLKVKNSVQKLVKAGILPSDVAEEKTDDANMAEAKVDVKVTTA